MAINSNQELNILLVDDRPENLFSLEKVLEDERLNLKFFKAESGTEALKIALKEELALIMLDVQMPGMDGYEVAKILKESSKTRNIPVIFVTAINYETSYVVKGYEFGAIDYLFKPLDPQITRAKVVSFLQIYIQQKELEYKNDELEHLGLLVNLTTDLMYIYEPQKETFIHINPAVERFTGRTLEELNSDNHQNSIIDGELMELFKNPKDSKQVIQNYEQQHNGNCWISWSFTLNKGKWYAVGRNITARKESEDKLASANAELEKKVQDRTAEISKTNKELKYEVDRRAYAEEHLRIYNEMLIEKNKELDNFVYTASHDLKLPIANLEGLIKTLKEEIAEDSDQVENVLSMLGHSVTQLKETVQDLLKVIQVQKERLEEPDNFDCKEVIEEIKFSIKELIEEAAAIIITDIQRCDELKLTKSDFRSIIYNLMSNAIKYRSPKRIPEVQVKMYETDEHFVIKVSDNGLGIPEDQQQKLFSIFKRVYSHVEGSGIGLFIVKKAVERYNGYISVESAVDKGTEFKIFFNKPKPVQ
ncbi:MAG: hybrid sensor histidine kinase/response regulator [Sporocytophaga sp.]|uniref:hybrid sensor histidine kinase/response regulator n=1 Tax=Sporocytophaga sp. TaxID=2231183 RepID=UPI001B165AC5|nr:hybrid sensor histidine kinase/response regulator [Sporocytophaga sp.]MBO9698651.1 hybrid sensor histidine kinase/response regulator [Sporocytophaga sp.]